MGRYSSDSDEDRRKKYKSSRKRDKRSRSRERRKRSRSRDNRRRSRSRSSSYEDYRRSRSSKKDRRYSRSSSSRSHSSSSSDDERRRSRNDKKSSTSSSQLSKEQTRRKMKKALAKAESKDEVLKRDKAVKELKQLAPDKEAILQIESNEFVPQSFSSSANNKAHQNDKENKDDSHEAAMFGTRSSVPVATSIAAVSEVKAVSQPVVSQTNDKEGLFASWLHEDEETKTARWITKLKKMRQELLAAT